VSSTESSGLSSTGSTGASDQRPLTQQEYQLLQRLLSDPFSLPIQFKSWLVSYLETSDLSLPIGAIQGLTAILGITGVGASGTLGILPAGIILPYGGSTAPTGAKMCDGAGYSTTTEQRLFQAIGYSYGGSGPTFNVPDMQERIPVGKGVLALLNALGKNEGRALGSRGIIHSHTKNGTVTKTGTVTFTANPQGFNPNPGTGGTGATTGDRNPQQAAISDTIGISDTISIGPAGTPLDGPAFLVINFIVVA
jgi:microcystin-dependent protein